MKKPFPAVLLAVIVLAGCAATQQSVTPDLKITREIPTEAALTWLKKVAAPARIGSRVPACKYNGQGILSRDGKSTVAWAMLRSSPWSVGFSHTIGSYAVYVMDTRDAVAGWVTVSRRETRDSAGFIFSDHGDECGAFYVHHRTANESQIAEVQKNTERTLSALAALGVVIEQQPRKGAQP